MARKKFDFDQSRVEKLKQSINDSKLCWHTIRSVNRKAAIYNSITKEQWYEHFFKVFNPPGANLDTILHLDEASNAETVEETHEVLFNEVISKQAVIGKLKSGKCAGPDKIFSEMLMKQSLTF